MCGLPGVQQLQRTARLHSLQLQGDVVAISPYQSHLDPRLYLEAPANYNPSREGMRLGAGSAAQHSAAVPGVGEVPGLSFGGGKYLCPGRFLAEAELALVTSLLLLLFDWQLLPRECAAVEAAAGAAAGVPAAAKQIAAVSMRRRRPRLETLQACCHRQTCSSSWASKCPAAGPCWVQYRRRRGGPPPRPASPPRCNSVSALATFGGCWGFEFVSNAHFCAKAPGQAPPLYRC